MSKNLLLLVLITNWDSPQVLYWDERLSWSEHFPMDRIYGMFRKTSRVRNYSYIFLLQIFHVFLYYRFNKRIAEWKNWWILSVIIKLSVLVLLVRKSSILIAGRVHPFSPIDTFSRRPGSEEIGVSITP